MVLSDDFDPVMIEAFEQQPPELSPIHALRMALQAAFAQLSAEQHEDQRVRTILVLTVPELRAAMLDPRVQAMERWPRNRRPSSPRWTITSSSSNGAWRFDATPPPCAAVRGR